MPLWDLIKEQRQKLGLSQRQFALKLGCSSMHISVIERPSQPGELRLPSEPLLRKIAALAASSEEERLTTERELLLERARLVVSEEVKEHFLAEREKENIYLAREGMPLPFRGRLKSDLEKAGLSEECFRSISLSADFIDHVLEGRSLLSKRAVTALAGKLGQPVEEYLLLSDYMPEEIKAIARQRGLLNLFRRLGELNPEDLGKFLKIIEDILAFIKKG